MILTDLESLCINLYIKILLFTDSYFVPVLRSDDNSTQAVIGEPWSHDQAGMQQMNSGIHRLQEESPVESNMCTKAYAGPMSPSEVTSCTETYMYMDFKVPVPKFLEDEFSLNL